MREPKEMPSVAAKRCGAIAVLPLLFLAGASLWTGGCGIKKTIKVEVPPHIRSARQAGFEDLLGALRRYDGIKTLSCSDMELGFTSTKKREIGELEKWRSINGYILLRRPDSIHFVLLIPVTKSTFLDVLSVGDKLSVWYPRKNEFYLGRNSQKDFIVEDESGTREFSVPVRGTHIFEAILPQGLPLDSPGTRVSLEELADNQNSYYVLSFFREGKTPRMYLLRKIWIERAGLTIARQQVFEDDGRLVSDIVYSESVLTGSFLMPLRIHIDRPTDGYMLDLKFKKWNVNPDLPENAFELEPPPGARTITLQEKGPDNAF
jgi:hypothetical protein